MKNPFYFFVETVKQPTWVAVWVFFLLAINLASAVFWAEPLGKLIFITFIASAVLMLSLYSRFGYAKILGLGHILWVPLLVYILTQMSAASGGFKSYLITLSVSIAISLAFDVVDVWQYFSGGKSA